MMSHTPDEYKCPICIGLAGIENDDTLLKQADEVYKDDNEPAGNQHAFHYHHHIYPRYDGDLFNINMTKKSILSEPQDRISYADKLKAYLA